MTLSKKERFRLAEQAALRLIRTHEHDSEAERADFLAWTRLSAHHVHESMFAQAVSKQLESVDPQRAIDVDALPDLPKLAPSVNEYEPFEQAVESIDRSAFTVAHRSRRWTWPLSLAAVLLVAVCLGWLSRGGLNLNRELSTEIGEQRSVKLDDGSVMILNTGSRVAVQYSSTVRRIRLLDGEALFVVQRDRERPFEVSTDSGTIVAVGTQFNVYKRGASTRVSVLEGAVKISAGNAEVVRTSSKRSTALPGSAVEGAPVHLSAGDEAVIDAGEILKAPEPDVQRTLAWRARQLVFRDSSLAAVADEFNRYNKMPIHVEGDALRRRSISGVFDADDPEPLVNFLRSDAELTVVQEEAGIFIRQKR